MKIYTIPTWSCACGYTQDFEPTAENMKIHFADDPQFPLNVMAPNQCPSCSLKGTVSKLEKQSDFTKKIRVSVLEDADIEAKGQLTEDRKANHKVQAAQEHTRILAIKEEEVFESKATGAISLEAPVDEVVDVKIG